MPHDDSDRGEKLDDGYTLVVEGADSTNGELIQTRHIDTERVVEERRRRHNDATRREAETRSRVFIPRSLAPCTRP